MALPASGKRSAATAHRPWRFLDRFMAALFLAVLLFFTLVLTPLAASGRSTLSAAAGSDLRSRNLVISAVDAPGPVPLLEVCPKEAVDYVPCEDPRHFDGERHCPAPKEASLCLIPPPVGYLTPVRWPESLQKVWDFINGCLYEVVMVA